MEHRGGRHAGGVVPGHLAVEGRGAAAAKPESDLPVGRVYRRLPGPAVSGRHRRGWLHPAAEPGAAAGAARPPARHRAAAPPPPRPTRRRATGGVGEGGGWRGARREGRRLSLPGGAASAPPRRGVGQTPSGRRTRGAFLECTTPADTEITGPMALRLWVEADGTGDIDLF